MEEKYYEILRHYVNPNDCATVVKQLLSLHNVVGRSEQCCSNPKHKGECNEMFESWTECKNCGKEII